MVAIAAVEAIQIICTGITDGVIGSRVAATTITDTLIQASRFILASGTTVIIATTVVTTIANEWLRGCPLERPRARTHGNE
jgi:hypothetical protein